MIFLNFCFELKKYLHSKNRDNTIKNQSVSRQLYFYFYSSLMGASNAKSTGKTANGQKLFSPKYYESEEKAIVSVRSRDFEIAGQTFQHHFLVAKIGSDDLFRVFEWGTRPKENKNEPEFYATAKINGKICLTYYALVPLSSITKAARQVSDSREYGWATFNCAHWTEEVCRKFNWNVTVNGICDCQSKNSELDNSGANIMM